MEPNFTFRQAENTESLAELQNIFFYPRFFKLTDTNQKQPASTLRGIADDLREHHPPRHQTMAICRKTISP